jgi:hypothetical protein
MPSKSNSQRRFMAAAAHNPQFAAKAGIPVSVAKEFHEADRGKYGARTKSGKKKHPKKERRFGQLSGPR